MARVKIYLFIEMFWVKYEKIKKIKTVNTKKDIATSKFIKWYISLIVGDNITKIIGAKNELKKTIYNKFTPSDL